MTTRSTHSIVFSVVAIAPLIAHAIPLPEWPAPEPSLPARQGELYLYSAPQPRSELVGANPDSGGGVTGAAMRPDKEDSSSSILTPTQHEPTPQQISVSPAIHDSQAMTTPSLDSLPTEPCDPTGHMLSARLPGYIFPVAGLTLLSCIFVMLLGLLVYLMYRCRCPRDFSAVVYKPNYTSKPPSIRKTLSISVPEGHTLKSMSSTHTLKPIPELSDPFPPTPTQSMLSHQRPLSPILPSSQSLFLPPRYVCPESPARSTFTTNTAGPLLSEKPSFLSLKG